MRDLVIAIFQAGSASVIALGLGVVATKIFAVVLGPAGIGLVALVRQTYQTALILGTLNGQTAMAQGIASREGESQARYLSTVLWVLLLAGSVTALAFLLWPSHIMLFVTGRQIPASVSLVRWLSFGVLSGVCSTYLLGVLSGYRAIGRIALLQIVGAAVAAALAYPVAIELRAGHTLALAVQIILPALATGALGLIFVMRGGWVPAAFRHVALSFHGGAAKDFLRLAAATLVGGFLGTSLPLAVRGIAARRFGLPGVGIIDVALNISTNYAALAVASFYTYYLPSLSRLMRSPDRQQLIQRMLRLSIALMVPLVVATTTLKPAVVHIFYSPSFLPALKIMRWMFISDYLRVTSWVFSVTMLAQADVRTVVWTEIVWGGVNVGGAALSILHFNSLEGVGVNFVFLYATYLAFNLAYVGSRRHFVLDAPIARTWLIGLGIILAASAQTWNDLAVRPVVAAAYIAIAACFSWAALTAEERRGIRNGLRQTLYRAQLTALEP